MELLNNNSLLKLLIVLNKAPKPNNRAKNLILLFILKIFRFVLFIDLKIRLKKRKNDIFTPTIIKNEASMKNK